MAAKKETVSSLFSLYRSLQADIEAKKDALHKLEADADIYKQRLMALIPNGETRDGVIHKHFEKRSVSYAEALKQVTERLVPKTKAREVSVIVEANTKIVASDKIELADE